MVDVMDPHELSMVEARDRMAAGLGIPPELIPLEGIEANRPPADRERVDMIDALDAAVDLMVERIKVLRRVRRLELERRDALIPRIEPHGSVTEPWPTADNVVLSGRVRKSIVEEPDEGGTETKE